MLTPARLREARQNANTLSSQLQNFRGHLLNVGLGGPDAHRNLAPIAAHHSTGVQGSYELFERRVREWGVAGHYNPQFLVQINIAATQLVDGVNQVMELSRNHHWPEPIEDYEGMRMFLNALRDPYNFGDIPELETFRNQKPR